MHLRAGFGDRVKRKGTIMHVLSSILNINARPNIGTHANEDNTKITSTDGSKTKHDPRLSNIFIPNETHSYRALKTRPTDGPSLSSPSIQSSSVGFKNLSRKQKRKNRTRPFFFSKKGKGLSASTSWIRRSPARITKRKRRVLRWLDASFFGRSLLVLLLQSLRPRMGGRYCCLRALQSLIP